MMLESGGSHELHDGQTITLRTIPQLGHGWPSLLLFERADPDQGDRDPDVVGDSGPGVTAEHLAPEEGWTQRARS
jgi:hypothetical protein